MHVQSHYELHRGITPIEMVPSPYVLIISICIRHVDMNVFAKFDEILPITLRGTVYAYTKKPSTKGNNFYRIGQQPLLFNY